MTAKDSVMFSISGLNSREIWISNDGNCSKCNATLQNQIHVHKVAPNKISGLQRFITSKGAVKKE
jgi:hypothetical protein